MNSLSEETEMKTRVAMAMAMAMAMVAVVSVLDGCAKQSAPPITEVVMAPVDVGTKTPDYEVVSPTELKLAPGVKLQVLQGAGGQNNGFVLLRDNGGLSGFMSLRRCDNQFVQDRERQPGPSIVQRKLHGQRRGLSSVPIGRTHYRATEKPFYA
jgi:hypothetical protein